MKSAMPNKIAYIILIFCLIFISACTHSEPAFMIPEDKDLPEDWVSSLTTRGKPEVWSGDPVALYRHAHRRDSHVGSCTLEVMVNCGYGIFLKVIIQGKMWQG